jgi:hypothetical protein
MEPFSDASICVPRETALQDIVDNVGLSMLLREVELLREVCLFSGAKDLCECSDYADKICMHTWKYICLAQRFHY